MVPIATQPGWNYRNDTPGEVSLGGLIADLGALGPTGGRKLLGGPSPK